MGMFPPRPISKDIDGLKRLVVGRSRSPCLVLKGIVEYQTVVDP